MIKFSFFGMNPYLNKAFLILLLLMNHNNYSQSINIKKVTLDDIRNKVCEFDSTANAIILYKYRDTYFNDLQPDKWEIITNIHERIKILNKKGMPYATKHIQLEKSDKNKEVLSSIKASVYSYNGKRISVRKIKKENIKKRELSQTLDEVKIELSNVKAGDIVEFSYKIVSSFYKINNVILQEDIPTKYGYTSIKIPSYFSFDRIVNGHLDFSVNEYEQSLELKPLSSQKRFERVSSGYKETIKDSILQTTQKIVEYEVKNIKALKSGVYVDNIQNYRTLVRYNLVSTNFYSQGVKEYISSWEDIIETIYKSERFNGQLQNLLFLEKEAEYIKQKSSNSLEIIENSLSHIKTRMLWNKKYGVLTEKTLKDSYFNKAGNVAEINLILIGLLRKCGLNANPVLIRTRDQGALFFPSSNSFNYVLASVENNGEIILLDATETLSTINVLPIRTINGEGTIIFAEDNMKNIQLSPYMSSHITNIMEVTINKDGSAFGKINTNYTQYDAMIFRKELNKSSNNFLMLSKNKYGINNIKDYNIKNEHELNKVLTETFSFSLTNEVDIRENQISFSPLFFIKLDKNPFKLKKRDYPVNFSYPRIRKKVISIHLPNGYKVVSLPKPIKIGLPDNLGSYMFNISKVKGGINLISIFKLNEVIILSNMYFELKEFYNQRILKEIEKVILEKE